MCVSVYRHVQDDLHQTKNVMNFVSDCIKMKDI